MSWWLVPRSLRRIGPNWCLPRKLRSARIEVSASVSVKRRDSMTQFYRIPSHVCRTVTRVSFRHTCVVPSHHTCVVPSHVCRSVTRVSFRHTCVVSSNVCHRACALAGWLPFMVGLWPPTPTSLNLHGKRTANTFGAVLLSWDARRFQCKNTVVLLGCNSSALLLPITHLGSRAWP